MKKILIAASVILMGVLALDACNKGGTCAGTSCTSIECKPDELPGWCKVEITTVNPPCITEQPFGFCVKMPKNGFPPNTDLNNFIWRGAQEPVRALVKQAFGTNVGFTLMECKAGQNNPYVYDVNSAKILVQLKGRDGVGPEPRDEVQCESCAAAICNLDQCGADSNCSCWVSCAFADATLASCPSTCGPQGGVTQSLVQCLVQDCGPACGVSSSLPECNGSSSSSSGSPACGMTGDLCGAPGEPDCCGICGIDGLCE